MSNEMREDLGRLLLDFSEHFGRLGRSAFRGRRTHGEFIAHLAGFISKNRSGHKSVINNSRRARFVAAYEICLVTGFSVAPPAREKRTFLPFSSSSATVRRKDGYLRMKGRRKWWRQGGSQWNLCDSVVRRRYTDGQRGHDEKRSRRLRRRG